MSAPKHIVGCLSMMRTGSSALAAALRAANFPDAVHIHFLGENATPRPFPVTPQIHAATAQLAESDTRFTLVTCVRDPIARWISQAFHNAETRRARTGVDIVADGEAFLAWMNAKDGLDYSTDWFDESLRTTFGFEFRRHPFHRERRSIRYEAGRLRLLVLRQEDPQPGKRSSSAGLSVDRGSSSQSSTMGDRDTTRKPIGPSSRHSARPPPGSTLSTKRRSPGISTVWTNERPSGSDGRDANGLLDARPALVGRSTKQRIGQGGRTQCAA